MSRDAAVIVGPVVTTLTLFRFLCYAQSGEEMTRRLLYFGKIQVNWLSYMTIQQ